MTTLTFIPDLTGYLADTEGTIWTLWEGKGRGRRIGPTPRRLATRINKGGYVAVYIGVRSVRKWRLVHRLILLTFRGPCPTGMECRHLNDIHTDNRLENLAWGTKLQNAADKRANGRMAHTKGSRNGRATLSEESVIRIRELRSQDVSPAELMEMFGIPRGTLDGILSRRTWSHV